MEGLDVRRRWVERRSSKKRVVRGPGLFAQLTEPRRKAISTGVNAQDLSYQSIHLVAGHILTHRELECHVRNDRRALMTSSRSKSLKITRRAKCHK